MIQNMESRDKDLAPAALTDTVFHPEGARARFNEKRETRSNYRFCIITWLSRVIRSFFGFALQRCLIGW